MAAQDAQCPYPALYLLPLDESFYPAKRIPLPLPPGSINGHGTITAASNGSNGQGATGNGQGRGAIVRIGRQLNQKTAPAAGNGVFESRVLSRQHAEVWVEGGRILIRDVKSSNGTFVNGERLSGEGVESDAFELRSDDILEFGIDILGEHGEVVHRKVAARATCAFSPTEAQRAVRAEERVYPPAPLPPHPNGHSNSAPPTPSAAHEANPYNPNVNGTRHARSDSSSSSGGGMGRGAGQGGITGMGGMGAERIRPLSMGVDLDGFLARVRDGPRAAAAAAARAGTSPGAGVGAPHTQSLGVVSSRAAMNMVNGNVPARIHAGTIGHAPPHGAVGVAGIVPRKDSVSPPAAGAAGGPAAAEQAPEEDPLVTQLRAQLAETRSILDQAMSAASNLELRYSSAADVNADTAPAPEETDATHTGTRSLRDELATLRSEVREAQVEEGRRRARARGRGRAGTILADVESASPAPPAADVPPHRPPHLLLHGDQGEGDEDAEDNDDDSEEREKGQRGGAADEQWADDVDFRAEVADMKVPLSPASSAARVERLRGVFDEDDDDLADDSSDGSFLGGLGGGAEADVDAASAEDGEGEQKDGQEDRAVDGVPAARGDEAGASASGLGAEDEAALAARLDIIADQLATLQSRLASMQSAPLAVSAEGTESALDGLDGRVRALEEAVPAESSAPFAITLPSLPSALPSSSPSAVAPSPTDSDSLEVEKLKSSLLSTLASLKIEWETFREETSAFSRPAFLYAPRSDADATVSDDDKADMSDASDSENTKSAPSLLGPTWREDPDDARVPGRWGLLTPAGSVRAMSPARASALAPTWPVPLPLGAFSSPAANGLPAMNDTAPAFVEKHGDETVPAHPVEMVAEDAGKPATKEVKGDPFLLFGAVGAGVAIVAAAWWGA